MLPVASTYGARDEPPGAKGATAQGGHLEGHTIHDRGTSCQLHLHTVQESSLCLTVNTPWGRREKRGLWYGRPHLNAPIVQKVCITFGTRDILLSGNIYTPCRPKEGPGKCGGVESRDDS
jgi:hypothetical protein